MSELGFDGEHYCSVCREDCVGSRKEIATLRASLQSAQGERDADLNEFVRQFAEQESEVQKLKGEVERLTKEVELCRAKWDEHTDYSVKWFKRAEAAEAENARLKKALEKVKKVWNDLPMNVDEVSKTKVIEALAETEFIASEALHTGEPHHEG